MDRGLAARSSRDGRDVRTGCMTLPASEADVASMAAVRAERRRCSSWTGRPASQRVREIEPRRVSDRMSPMKFRYRKQVALVAGFAIAIAVALVALGWRRSASEGPTYEGRTLREWVESIDLSHFPDRTSPFFLQTSNAIVQIGTNGLPFLLEWIRYKPSRTLIVVGSAIEDVSHRLPSTPVGDAIVDWAQRGFRRAEAAVVAFEILGQTAESCANDLAAIVRDSTDKRGAGRATYALAELGDSAYPHLRSIALDTKGLSRTPAIRGMRLMRTNTMAAVPVLVQLLDDPDPEICRSAAGALGDIRLIPEVAVPALVEVLRHSNGETRFFAAWALGRYGANAVVAIPALQVALGDSQAYVRDSASNSLQVITSTVTTNAATQ